MEKEAFERQLLALSGAMYRVAASILPRQCDREDCIQESILIALQQRDRLRDARALRPWVMRILVNNCYDTLRQQRRETSVEVLPEQRWESPPDADLMLRDLLLSMPGEQRLIMVMFYVEGYKLREIAEILHIPPGTVQSRLYRARRQLKESLIVIEKEGEA